MNFISTAPLRRLLSVAKRGAQFTVFCRDCEGCLAREYLDNTRQLATQLCSDARARLNGEFREGIGDHMYNEKAPTTFYGEIAGYVCGEHCPYIPEDKRSVEVINIKYDVNESDDSAPNTV